jgi:tight adherence protein B
VDPKLALAVTGIVIMTFGLVGYMLLGLYGAMVAIVASLFTPNIVIGHLETKRKEKLEAQLVDGITMLASGVRAGLNLIQGFELMVTNSVGPIKQEFSQMLTEYRMGLDLNQAMRNAANRIGSSNYRLLFTAIEMHRLRGGDAGESLDRIAESIREIQRLEGKLDALTAQGRLQAVMMASMPVVILIILYFIEPDGVRLLFVEPLGRILLLIVIMLIAVAFVWIRKIMAIDI